MITIDGDFGIGTKEVDILSRVDKRILKLLLRRDMYPMEMARELGMNEQTLYYHIKKLKRSGFIVESKRALVGGIKTTYFSLASKAFLIRIGEFSRVTLSKNVPKILDGFVKNGRLDALVIVGSPVSHGRFGNVSRDIESVSDLSMFLGHFAYSGLATVRDTNVRDASKNMIVVGGPAVNTVMEKLNTHLKIHFDMRWNIVAKKTYVHEDIGIVVRARNPWNKSAHVLVLAGRSYRGTRSAVVALVKHFDELTGANVVRGYDRDSDGVIDEVKILE